MSTTPPDRPAVPDASPALSQRLAADLRQALPADLSAGLAVGLDLVHIPRIEASLADFGERFVQRLFTEGEAAWARSSPANRAERLAARFAAKEAAIKAFDLSEAGVDWRDIEVVREPSGRPVLVLHGAVAERVRAAGFGPATLSLTHDGDHAGAIVVAPRRLSPSASFDTSRTLILPLSSGSPTE